jgi:hypothetical protein
MKYMPRAVAYGKLRALVEGAAIVRQEIAELDPPPELALARSKQRNRFGKYFLKCGVSWCAGTPSRRRRPRRASRSSGRSDRRERRTSCIPAPRARLSRSRRACHEVSTGRLDADLDFEYEAHGISLRLVPLILPLTMPCTVLRRLPSRLDLRERGRGRLLRRDRVVRARMGPAALLTRRGSARATPFGGLIASGWQTGCLAMRLMCDGYLTDSSCIASPGSMSCAGSSRCGRETRCGCAPKCSMRGRRRQSRTAASFTGAGRC